MFLVPSLFEPCGLTQMISLAYGTIPIVRETGGLADIIQDIDFSSVPESERNGFVFRHADNAGVDSALDRALGCWRDDRKRWKEIVSRAFKEDFSWDKSCGEYLRMYEDAREHFVKA